MMTVYLSVHRAPRVAGAVTAERPRPAVLADAGVVLAAAVRAAVHVAHARLAIVASPATCADAPDVKCRINHRIHRV